LACILLHIMLNEKVLKVNLVELIILLRYIQKV